MKVHLQPSVWEKLRQDWTEWAQTAKTATKEGTPKPGDAKKYLWEESQTGGAVLKGVPAPPNQGRTVAAVGLTKPSSI